MKRRMEEKKKNKIDKNQAGKFYSISVFLLTE